MKRCLCLWVCLLLLLSQQAWADYLADDFNAEPGSPRIILRGSLVATPAGQGKGWDGGTGWVSGMRQSISPKSYFGRKDFVSYHGLEPGRDLPLEEGTLEIWFQRYRPRGNDIDRDTLLQLLDAEGRSLVTLAIVYPDSTLPPGLIVAETNNVWGRMIPLPPLDVGQWAHLALTWGPAGAADNRIYFNGKEVAPSVGERDGNFGKVVQWVRGLKIGTGYADDDPAYHSLVDEFRFSGQSKTSFDLTRSLLDQP